MCGISGISFKGSDSEINISKIAKEMNRALIHRGPDDSNHWKNISNSLVFSHRRLSILDISKNGAQPMVSKSKRYIICFNGEIYNHLLLRKKIDQILPNRFSWKSNSDTETLLEAIELFGIEKTLEQLQGCFLLLFLILIKNLYSL